MELQKDDVKSKQQCLVRTSLLSPYPKEAQESIYRGLAALSEESLPYLSTSLDADIDMYNMRMRTCTAEVDKSETEADVLRVCDGGTDSTCGLCYGGSHVQLGEDSQLEYISANEEGFDDGNSSREFPEQREAEHCTGAEAAMAELPQLFHNSLLVGSAVACDQKEEQAASLSGLAGHMLDNNACRSTERSYLNLLAIHHSEVKDASSPDSTQPQQNHRCVHSNLAEGGCPSLSPRERAPAKTTELCKRAGDSEFYSCEDPLLHMCSASCAYRAAKVDENRRPVPAVLSIKDLCSGEEASGKSCSAKTSLNLECCESLGDVVGRSKVNQAVDASCDFRVCFTTSRSTSARVPLSSRAINTEVTMMNEFRCVGSPGETRATVAGSTDRLSGPGPTEEMGSQLADVHQDGSAGANESRSQDKEQRESKAELCSSCLKIMADRPAHISKDTVKDSVSVCQSLLQRAIEAELQVLNAHYQMCYRHCLKIHKLALEEKACFGRYYGNTSANTEVDSTVTSVLEELNKNYSSMRAKIQTGTPLSTLPPLSVEIKSLPIVSSYVPCQLFGEELHHGSFSGMRKAGFEASGLQEIRTPVYTESAQTTCLTDSQQPSDSASSKVSQEQLKEQGVQHGSVRNKEWNECWFDAREDFAVTDLSLVSEEVGKHPEKQDTVGLRGAKITEGANECTFVCIGGLSSSVSEDDLRSHFQKYQISVILLCEDSDNHRCAFLGFKDTSSAKLAVEKMNKTQMKGKPISVELVSNPSENRSLASNILGKKLWCEALSVANSASRDQSEMLPSAPGCVAAPGTSSASQKVPLQPGASAHTPGSTQVPSEARSPKSSAEGSATGGNSLPKAPAAPASTNSLEAFMSPKALNLSSFAKLMKKLKDVHPEASRDKIVDALLEVRKNNNGVLSGLSISSIMERASVILRKPTAVCTGKGSGDQ
ncbi:RNA-binding protein 44 isoform X1 [Coturnix japonica]|uniref:RNA-binding protein 44 isoform X1 n=1 Tax=Coturnix japonica TaxID=93934 RepID=UPI0007778712|nr:RNA-binding protein 44 isoform X1 [Coturnix japonica]